jgi:hypothetical protein
MQINFSFSVGGFKWGKNKSELVNRTKKQPARPAQKDLREYPVANAGLTEGLYHNSFPGLKLAGAMAYSPIAIPVSFMGLPVAVTEDDEDVQDILDNILKMFASRMVSIHTQCHREGTIWVWPNYDAGSRQLRWEFITDDTVSDIVVDVNTHDIIEIHTDEEIIVSTGNGQYVTARRRRTFTKQKITVRWSGEITGAELNDAVYRNPINMLPIPFANNADGDKKRGHSDYERIIPDLKDYHDIDLNQSNMLSKFKIKMVQHISDNFDQWMDNNGYDNITDIDIAATDFVVNMYDREKTEYLYPSRAFEAWEAALKRKYRKIVEGSAMPEFLWGVATQGNHATSEETLNTFINYVKGKQQQKIEAYEELFVSSLRLLQMAGEIVDVPEIEIKWNDMSATSEKTKAEIFGLFGKGISDLINCAGITKEQIHNLWEQMYPQATEDDYERFVVALSNTAKHKQYKDADYVTTMDIEQGTLEDDSVEELTDI